MLSRSRVSHAETDWRQLHISPGAVSWRQRCCLPRRLRQSPTISSLLCTSHSVKTCTVIGNSHARGFSYRKLHAATSLVITLESCCKRPTKYGPRPAAACNHTHLCRALIQRALNSSTALNTRNIFCQTTCANTAITTKPIVNIKKYGF